jgi:hypothetical protein
MLNTPKFSQIWVNALKPSWKTMASGRVFSIRGMGVSSRLFRAIPFFRATFAHRNDSWAELSVRRPSFPGRFSPASSASSRLVLVVIRRIRVKSRSSWYIALVGPVMNGNFLPVRPWERKKQTPPWENFGWLDPQLKVPQDLQSRCHDYHWLYNCIPFILKSP